MNKFEFQEKTGYSPKIPVKKKLFEKRSKYQKIEVFETELFGNMLVLDGSIQTTEKDEFIYHEMIIYPVLAIADGVKNVLIVGGGDGGVAKEVLRYDPEIDVEIVEIDEAVIDMSKRFLPEVSSVLDRVKINIEDGVEFLQKMRE
jgi:Spermidine synthase